MKIDIMLSKNELKELVIRSLESQITNNFDPALLRFEVKSKQNFKSEWEDADIRVIYSQIN